MMKTNTRACCIFAMLLTASAAFSQTPVKKSSVMMGCGTGGSGQGDRVGNTVTNCSRIDKKYVGNAKVPSTPVTATGNVSIAAKRPQVIIVPRSVFIDDTEAPILSNRIREEGEEIVPRTVYIDDTVNPIISRGIEAPQIIIEPRTVFIDDTVNPIISREIRRIPAPGP